MRLFIPITRDDFEQLQEITSTERRRPQDQAAILLSRALRAETHKSSPKIGPREAYILPPDRQDEVPV